MLKKRFIFNKNYHNKVYKMEHNTILPNPFKILEQQIAKKESLNNKCNSCVENDNDKVENNEDGFTNLKGSQSIKEGFKEDKSQAWWLFILLAIAVSSASAYGMISTTIIKIPNFEDIKDDDNTEMISKYKNYLSENKFSIKMNGIVFVAFLLMSYLGALIAIEHENKMGFVVLIGFIMFVLSKSTAIIDFFENTFGYLLISPGLNMRMRSDNFESIINNNPEKASISFNPLITLFNMENFAEQFMQIRFIDDPEDKNKDKPSSDFFAYYEAGESKETFFKYLLEKVKQKRIIGNSIWLLLTTFFTIGIMKGTNV